MNSLELPFYQPGPILAGMLALHNRLAKRPLPPILEEAPFGLEPLLDILYLSAPAKPQVGAWTHPGPRDFFAEDSSRAVVSFSGGKDSIASALLLRAEGFEVTLVHAAGMNRWSAKEEAAVAENLAGMMKLPLRVVNVAWKGVAEWAENPIRNVLLMAIAVDYGLKIGARVYSLGTHSEEVRTEAGAAHDTGPSDWAESIAAAASFFSSLIPGFRYRHMTRNQSGSFRAIFDHAPELLPALTSCMIGTRYRKAHQNAARRLYGVELLPRRCGVCHKCAAEWLTLEAAGIEKKNSRFHDRSLRVLQRSYRDHYLGKDARPSLKEAAAFFIDPAAFEVYIPER